MNPDDVSPEFIEGLKELNFNRISLGVQSWRDEELKMLNRRHDSSRARSALEEIAGSGFENISIDLIYGIPGMSTEDWNASLDYTFSLGIKHLSAYHLTFEKGDSFRKDARKRADGRS